MYSLKTLCFYVFICVLFVSERQNVWKILNLGIKSKKTKKKTVKSLKMLQHFYALYLGLRQSLKLLKWKL